jgi:hypothetical protein
MNCVLKTLVAALSLAASSHALSVPAEANGIAARQEGSDKVVACHFMVRYISTELLESIR